MPDAELERLLGPGVEPTERFLSSLRERVADEWRGARPTRAKRRHWVRVALAAAAVVALVGGAIALFGRDSHQSVAPAVTTTTMKPDARGLRPIATIVFDGPTDAWVSASEGRTDNYKEYVDTPGRHVLYQRDGAWVVGYFDEQGLMEETPVDKVPDGEEHRVTWTLQPENNELLTVDGYTYRRESELWVQTGPPFEGSVAPAPSVDLDRSTPEAWTINGLIWRWTVPKPVNWNGQPPTMSIVRLSSNREYDVAMVAHTATESVFWSLNADGSVVSGSLEGIWSLLNADEQRLELGTIDPARRDYSVVRVTWASLLD